MPKHPKKPLRLADRGAAPRTGPRPSRALGPSSTLAELAAFFAAKQKRSKAISKRAGRAAAMKSATRRCVVRRQLPQRFKCWIVQCAYGSATDFSVPRIRPAELARIFTVP